MFYFKRYCDTKMHLYVPSLFTLDQLLNMPLVSPYHIMVNNQIESVQRKFTKRPPGFKGLNYSERLVRSGMERLELRRIKQDLTVTHKIYFVLVDIKATDLSTPANTVTYRDTRSHKYKLLQNHCHVDVRKYYFAECVIRQ
jgi:hypothetical protein